MKSAPIVRLEATEGGTLVMCVTPDGDLEVSIVNDAGRSTVRFCTVTGGEIRAEQTAFRRGCTEFVKFITKETLTVCYCECCEGNCKSPFKCPWCNQERPCGDGSHCQNCWTAISLECGNCGKFVKEEGWCEECQEQSEELE